MHHWKARLLFWLSDALLTVIAFEAAYHTRLLLPLGPNFYLMSPIKALLLGASILTWLLIGYWLELYDRLDSAHVSVVIRDTFRQCVLGSVVLILFQFVLRLDLSRSFLLLFALYSWF